MREPLYRHRYSYGPNGELRSIERIDGPRSIPVPIPPISARTKVRVFIRKLRRRLGA